MDHWRDSLSREEEVKQEQEVKREMEMLSERDTRDYSRSTGFMRGKMEQVLLKEMESYQVEGSSDQN